MTVSELPRTGPDGADRPAPTEHSAPSARADGPKRPAPAGRTASAGRGARTARAPEQEGSAQIIELPVPRAGHFSGCPARTVRRSSADSVWAARVMLVTGALLLPWLVVLALTLPSMTLAWVGLDAMEAAGLITTGLLVLRRHPLRTAAAAVTATLLLVDAWFDTTTSGGVDLVLALVLAAVAELPLAALCAAVALRAAREQAAAQQGPVGPSSSAAGRRKG